MHCFQLNNSTGKQLIINIAFVLSIIIELYESFVPSVKTNNGMIAQLYSVFTVSALN